MSRPQAQGLNLCHHHSYFFEAQGSAIIYKFASSSSTKEGFLQGLHAHTQLKAFIMLAWEP